jgi:hypothetical protein
LFSSGKFLKIAHVAKIYGLLSCHDKNLVGIYIDKKMAWADFWAGFYKIIWSH